MDCGEILQRISAWIDDDILLQAYHYLASSTVQAFAAITALVGMFYIYLISRLEQFVKDSDNYVANSKNNRQDDSNAIRKATDKGNNGMVSRMRYYTVEEMERLRKVVLNSTFLAALAMLIGILALVVGPFLRYEGLYIAVMVIEMVFAVIALWKTVVTVKNIINWPSRKKKSKTQKETRTSQEKTEES